MYDIFIQLLQSRGITTYAVAKATGISQATFTDWKSGKSSPKADKLKKIADYFGVPVDYLLTGENRIEKPVGGNADELSVLQKNPKFKMICEKLSALSPEALEIARAQIELLLKSQGPKDPQEK